MLGWQSIDDVYLCKKNLHCNVMCLIKCVTKGLVIYQTNRNSFIGLRDLWRFGQSTLLNFYVFLSFWCGNLKEYQFGPKTLYLPTNLFSFFSATWDKWALISKVILSRWIFGCKEDGNQNFGVSSSEWNEIKIPLQQYKMFFSYTTKTQVNHIDCFKHF